MGLLIALGCAGLTDSSPSPPEPAAEDAQPRPADPVPGIMKALANNAITEGQAQQYLWAALLRTPGQIPDGFDTADLDAVSMQQATEAAHMLMQRVSENWSRYSDAEQRGIAQSMDRAGISMFNLLRPGSAGEDTWSNTDGLFFCRYQQLGSPGQHLDLYDEISAELPRCDGRPATDCSNIRTTNGQVACIAEVQGTRCRPKRYFTDCEPGWLDPDYAAQRDELLEHAPRPHQLILDKLGLRSRSSTTPLADLILIHAPGNNIPAVTRGDSGPGRKRVFFAADQAPSAGCSGAPTLRLGHSISHELFHVAQMHSARRSNRKNEEASATWFENYVHPSWDSEHSLFSKYHCSPGLEFSARAYHGGRALYVLLAGQEQRLFDWMQEASGNESSAPAGLNLQQKLAGLPLERRERLHTLTEQSYGLTINATRNDVCAYTAADAWRHTTCNDAGSQPDRARTEITAAGSPVQISYTVPGMSWSGRLLSVPPEVQELSLQVTQDSNTRTSLMVGGPPERVIPLENGEQRFCLGEPGSFTGCLCKDIPEDRYISSDELTLVSTQLDSSEQTVHIVASAQQDGLPKPGCWQVVSGRGEVGGREMYTLDHGPVVRIMPRPETVPESWPACTVILVENHEQTAYTSRTPAAAGVEQRCTVQARTAFPAELRVTERSDAQESGTLSAFTRLRPYIEGRQHECTGGESGITDQGSPLIGPLGMLMVSTDGGREPTQYQYTTQPNGDRMTLVHDTVSNDGVPTFFEAELVEAPQQQCAFAAGVLQRALTRLGPR